MKKSLLAIVLFVAFTGMVYGQLVIDNVEYTPGRLTSLSGGNWISYSGDTLTNYIQVTSGNLGYSSYPYDSVGNKITIHAVTSSAEDAYREFATQLPDCNIYVSFLLRITSSTMSADTSTNGDYFMALLPSTSTTALVGRVSVKQSATSGKYMIGIRTSSSNTTNWSSLELDVDGTYLVVLNYNLITGNTNDVAKLWVNPALPGPETTADVVQASALTSDPADIARIAIRQGYTASSHMQTPDADIDGIMVGSTWESVTGVEGKPANNDLPVNFALKASPNPASSRSLISFSLPKATDTELSIFNIAGQKVATLAKGTMTAGDHSVVWQTNQVSNGVYFYQLQAGNRLVSQKIVVVK